MRTTLKRAFVAGSMAVSIGVPVGAYAVTLPMDTDDPETTESETWTPPRQQERDCDAPAETRAILEDAGIEALREAHRAEVVALREQWRANPDPEGREDFRARMTELREQHREEVLAAVAELDADAAKWLEEHWAGMSGPGPGQGGAGQGNGPGNGYGDRGGFRHGNGVGIQDQQRTSASS